MQTPYALKLQTNFVSFVYFLLNATTDANSFCAQVMKKLLKQFLANEMQGRVGNITVLFLHCIKKKAALVRSIIKEIRT